jgi:hypothetical protein
LDGQKVFFEVSFYRVCSQAHGLLAPTAANGKEKNKEKGMKVNAMFCMSKSFERCCCLVHGAGRDVWNQCTVTLNYVGQD